MKNTLAVLVAVLALSFTAEAQFIGYTSQQSTTSTPFNASTCTAALAANTVTVTNIGQGAHWVTLTGFGGSLVSLSYTIQGSYDGINFFDVSDVGTFTVNSAGVTGLTASGYYPVIGVKVGTCTPGTATITLKYSGISLPPGANYGTNQTGQLVKNIAVLAPANATLVSNVFRAPFGNANGTLQFNYSAAAGPSGSTLSISCGANAASLLTTFTSVSLQTTQNLVQTFQMPQSSCLFFTVTYTSGGASAATFNLDYAFTNLGVVVPAQQFSHITGTTATAIKATAGFVHSLNINTANAASGTVSLFDLPSASCTATPSTSTVAVVTTPASVNGLPPYIYDVNFVQGICLKASLAMDITVSFQ